MAITVNKGSFGVSQPSTSSHEIVAVWKFSKYAKCDHYTVDWEYSLVADKFIGGNSHDYTPEQSGITANNKQSRVSWTAPDNALQARARVKPVSLKYGKSNDKTYFTGKPSAYKTIDFRLNPLPAPTISVNFDANTSKAVVTVTAGDSDARTCWIRAYGGGKIVVEDKGKTLVNGTFTATYTVSAGMQWSFYAKTFSSSSKKESPWSNPSTAMAKPGVPTLVNNSWKAYGEDGITFTWKAVTGATSYTVEYVADNASYFNNNRDAVRSVSGITGTRFTQTGLEAGHIWYMRVQAVNDTGSSGWTNGSTAKAKLALVPDAPTTYDTDPSYKRNGSARLRWTHNCEDNADQSAVQVMLKLSTQSDSQATTVNVSPGTDMFYVRALSTYSDGSTVMWRVRTKGNRSEWSPWSIWRQFTVYDMPTVTCSLSQTDGTVDADDNPLASLPLTVSINASGGGSVVVGYHVTITASETVEVPHADGSVDYLQAGSVVFEKDYATSDSTFEAELGVEANLPDVASLSIIVDAVMQSGLRASSDAMPFVTNFGSAVPDPECSVSFDENELTATILAACYELDGDGMQTDSLVDGVELSVYRVNADGSLELIASRLPNDGAATAVDPHASFNVCEYRVVARSTETGMTSFEDGQDDSEHPTCVVQWGEAWDTYSDYEDEDGEAVYSFTYNRIDGLYNLNLEESWNMQSEDAEYIGRKHPVSYYGTQRGHTASYRVDFPKPDSDTLAKCRRLMDYAGDAYVREPSGLGFWAHVSNPRISRSYDSQAVSFTFDAIHVDHPEEAVR